MKNERLLYLGLLGLLLFVARKELRTQKAAEVGALAYFQPSDFGEWWPVMNADLVRKVDALANEALKYGYYVMISPAFGAIGRVYDTADSNDSSRHNVTKWGEVQALDIMVFQLDALGDHVSLAAGQASLFLSDINAQGFGGVGVYPFWKPFSGFHVDVRPHKADGTIATWGDVGQFGQHKYVALSEGMSKWGLA